MGISGKFKIGAAVLMILFLAAVARAHQPWLVMGASATLDDPITVNNPEISKAYYGELEGASNYYRITSDKEFELYLNILVPAIPAERDRRFSVEVLDETGGQILLIDGGDQPWKEFFEKYGRDIYLQGPETRLEIGPGTYLIKVFNKNNTGRYALAVGEIESFTVREILRAMVSMPVIKVRFFDKSPLGIFLNIPGLLLLLAALIILGGLIFLLRKKVFRPAHKTRE